MSTKLSATQHYAATPAEVFALFRDRAFIQARLDASGGLTPEIVSMDTGEDTGDDTGDDTVEVVTRQGIPASVLPSIVSSFIPGDPSTQRTETWHRTDAGYVADFTVTIHGAPASLKGTMTLAAEGAGSSLTIEGEAHVPVPIFGGKIEKVIVEQVNALFSHEEKFTQGRLAG